MAAIVVDCDAHRNLPGRGVSVQERSNTRLERLEHPNLLTDADWAIPLNEGFDMVLQLR
jgi:hypothetical protein